MIHDVNCIWLFCDKCCARLQAEVFHPFCGDLGFGKPGSSMPFTDLMVFKQPYQTSLQGSIQEQTVEICYCSSDLCFFLGVFEDPKASLGCEIIS